MRASVSLAGAIHVRNGSLAIEGDTMFLDNVSGGTGGELFHQLRTGQQTSCTSNYPEIIGLENVINLLRTWGAPATNLGNRTVVCLL